MRVMIVDDSKTMRMIARGIVEQLGISEVLEASDGLDALSKVGGFSPDLLLVDLNMPRMDGLTFVRQFRNSGGSIPIIMFAAEADRSRIIEAAKVGVSSFIVKPFTPDVLSQRVEQILRKSVLTHAPGASAPGRRDRSAAA